MNEDVKKALELNEDGRVTNHIFNLFVKDMMQGQEVDLVTMFRCKSAIKYTFEYLTTLADQK